MFKVPKGPPPPPSINTEHSPISMYSGVKGMPSETEVRVGWTATRYGLDDLGFVG